MKVLATMRRFGLSEREQERVWELWGNGTSFRAVTRRLGARPEYVRRYVTSTGGVKPVPRKRSECCVSKLEREEISRGLVRGDSCRAITAAIGRSPPRSRESLTVTMAARAIGPTIPMRLLGAAKAQHK